MYPFYTVLLHRLAIPSYVFLADLDLPLLCTQQSLLVSLFILQTYPNKFNILSITHFLTNIDCHSKPSIYFNISYCLCPVDPWHFSVAFPFKGPQQIYVTCLNCPGLTRSGRGRKDKTSCCSPNKK